MKWRNGYDTASIIFLSDAVNVIWLLNVFLRMNLDLGYEIFVFVKKMNVIIKCERFSHNVQKQIRSIFRCCQFANLDVISSFKEIEMFCRLINNIFWYSIIPNLLKKDGLVTNPKGNYFLSGTSQIGKQNKIWKIPRGKS